MTLYATLKVPDLLLRSVLLAAIEMSRIQQTAKIALWFDIQSFLNGSIILKASQF